LADILLDSELREFYFRSLSLRDLRYPENSERNLSPYERRRRSSFSEIIFLVECIKGYQSATSIYRYYGSTHSQKIHFMWQVTIIELTILNVPLTITEDRDCQNNLWNVKNSAFCVTNY